ncbi:TraR/DksA family transcriptional regulator [Serinicoccus sp. LYQ131]|uniref:TraR/DksA family transcriptional regulator n=1 Tax=Serinicoccus sp. LYQ131 TaxID=3378797 RepID=UPI00385565D6
MPTPADSDNEPAPSGPGVRLVAEREALTTHLARLTHDMAALVDASRDSNADDEHDPEGQTIAYERAQLAAMTDQARAHLQDVEAAQRRVAEGSYGRCDVCGEPIDPARLEARPTAVTCVPHASARPTR